MTVTLDTTPLSDGFRMPGEFEPHTGCWMLWPERPDVWRLQARPAQLAYAAVAAAVSAFEPLSVGVPPGQYQCARQLLPPHVRLLEMPCDDAWMRDTGPTFVVNAAGDMRGVDWEFNAWGGLYSSWDQDSRVARTVLEFENLDRYHPAGFILEGGSIHTDGQGTLLTTEECLLNPNRNPGLSKSEIESRLQQYLGIETIIWLPCGVFNDETSGHVDNLCCFIRPAVVALTWTDDRKDPQYERSNEAYDILAASVDARGRRFEIHKIPQPSPLFMSAEECHGIQPAEGTWLRREGQRLAASYVNFYVANQGVILPQFGDPNDRQVLLKVQELFPGRRVVGVASREILLGGGNIHCITLQQPAGIQAQSNP